MAGIRDSTVVSPCPAEHHPCAPGHGVGLSWLEGHEQGRNLGGEAPTARAI